MRRIIYTLYFASFGVIVSRYLIGVQKINNYNRCISVVSFSKKVGKLPKIVNIHNKCKYHLDKKYLGFL